MTSQPQRDCNNPILEDVNTEAYYDSDGAVVSPSSSRAASLSKDDQPKKCLATTEQVIWKDSEGKKILTFNFYEAKQKLTLQGQDNDIRNWIQFFLNETEIINNQKDTNKDSEKQIDEYYTNSDSEISKHMQTPSQAPYKVFRVTSSGKKLKRILRRQRIEK